jgi:hypothetical protein
MRALARHGVGMARIPTSAHGDPAATTSAWHVSTPAHDGAVASAGKSTGLPDGVVLFDGRVARIAGFESGAVKLRFAGGEDASVALADYVRRARAIDGGRRSGVADALLALPWHPTGQRAHHVRKLLDGYTAGRKTALRELANREM